MTKRSILVIDDESVVRKIICDNLILSGFDVTSAADGEEGLGMIDHAQPPKVVITDLIMPRKNGLEVIAEIRKSFPTVKTIAISGGGRIDDAGDLLEKARENGADVVLAKPLDMDELERTLEGLLG